MTNSGIFLNIVAFFFFFMALWIFMAIFGDIFHRNDLSGGAKAGWIFLLFILPFVGAMIYMISRPKMTEQDKQDRADMMEAQRRLTGGSTADELTKLAALRDKGDITAEEYAAMKAQATKDLTA